MQFSAALAFDDWQHLGTQLARMATSSAWYIGDWLVYGESEYADRYRHVLDSVGLSYQTLRNYAWVARNVPLSRRRDTLSFQHHMEIARLSPDDQTVWLERAVQQRWSATRLRNQLKADIGDTVGHAGVDHAVVPKITAGVERLSRWRTAAHQNHQELQHWIITKLDNAANHDLDGAID